MIPDSLRAASESWSCSAAVLHYDLARLFRLLTIGFDIHGPESLSRFTASRADRLIRLCSLETAKLQANLSYLEKCSEFSSRDVEKVASLVSTVKQLTNILDAELHTFEQHISEAARVSAYSRFWTSACQFFAKVSLGIFTLAFFRSAKRLRCLLLCLHTPIYMERYLF